MGTWLSKDRRLTFAWHTKERGKARSRWPKDEPTREVQGKSNSKLPHSQSDSGFQNMRQQHVSDERRTLVEKATQTDAVNEIKVNSPTEESKEEILVEISNSESYDGNNTAPGDKGPHEVPSSKSAKIPKREDIVVGGLSRAQFVEHLNNVGKRFHEAVDNLERSHVWNVRKTYENAVTRTAQHLMSRIRPYQASNAQCFIYDNFTENKPANTLKNVYTGLGIAVQSISSLDQIKLSFHEHDFIVIHFLFEARKTHKKSILESLQKKPDNIPCLLSMQTADCDEYLDSYGFVNVLAVCVDRSEFTLAFARNLQQQWQLLDVASIISMTINQMESYDMSYAMSDTFQNKVFFNSVS